MYNRVCREEGCMRYSVNRKYFAQRTVWCAGGEEPRPHKTVELPSNWTGGAILKVHPRPKARKKATKKAKKTRKKRGP